MNIPKGISVVILFVVTAMISIGCGGGPGDGPELGYVSGTVTMDDKPLKNARVTFSPIKKSTDERGAASSGVTDDKGYYTLLYASSGEGAKIGNHLVIITTEAAATEQGMIDNADADPDAPIKAEPIPAKYNSKAGKDMEREVKKGSNTFDFKLKK